MSEITLLINDTPVNVQVVQPHVDVAVVAPSSIGVVVSGPPGPMGPGARQYATDLLGVTPGVPIVVHHSLGTLDVSLQIVQKDTPGIGPGPGRVVEAGWSVTDANSVTIEMTGTGIPTEPGAFRVLVRGGSSAAELAVGAVAGPDGEILGLDLTGIVDAWLVEE